MLTLGLGDNRTRAPGVYSAPVPNVNRAQACNEHFKITIVRCLEFDLESQPSPILTEFSYFNDILNIDRTCFQLCVGSLCSAVLFHQCNFHPKNSLDI